MRTGMTVLAVALLALGCSPSGDSTDAGRKASTQVQIAPAPPPAAGPEPIEEAPPAPTGPVAPPPPPDPRTPAQIADAACSGADGQWHCPKRPRAVVRASAGASPLIPAAWTVPNWYVDPQNTTTCASDSNSCTSATCGAAGSGVGPCQTYQAINVQRWGCLGSPTGCPRLRQTTAIEFLSSHTDNTDPVIWRPTIENQASIVLYGPLGPAQTVSSGTLSNITAKNRSTQQLLLAQSGATATGQLVVNATHPSVAWTYKLSSGSIYKMTQPVTHVAPPIGVCSSTEVDTWTNGDAVTVYQPVAVNVLDVAPVFDQFNGSYSNAPAYLYNIRAFDPGPFDYVRIQDTWLVESSASRPIRLEGSLAVGFCNSFVGQLRGGVVTEVSTLVAGTLGIGPAQSQLLNVAFSGDALVAYTTVQNTMGGINLGAEGPFYFDTGFLFIYGDVKVTQPVWGAGTIRVEGSGRFVYPAGAGAAAANILGPSLQLNDQNLGCLGVPSVASPTPTCNITVTPAALDSNLGAASGCLYAPGGASICNYGY